MAKYKETPSGMFWFWCPGCECAHRIVIKEQSFPKSGQPVWTKTGTQDKPTLSPSLLMSGVCHLFIKEGKIQYLSDSKHKLAGQTIEMVEWED